MFRYFWLTIALIIAMSGLTIDASIEKAILLKAHGLNDNAKRELIDLIFDENFKGTDKSRAYYLLGEIAFNENRIQAATKTWGYIVEKYPDSDEALMVKERMDELSKVTLTVHTESFEIDDYSVAKLYLKNADFWAEGKDDRWMIDSSWIPKIEFALKWYDKVISEFPRSEVTRSAYIGKMRTLLSWREFHKELIDIPDDIVGRLIASAIFRIYIGQLVDTFRNFEKDFPNDITLQACRFQIGQAYFVVGMPLHRSSRTHDLEQTLKEAKFIVRALLHRISLADDLEQTLEQVKNDLEQAKKWFDEAIANSGENDTFHRQISEERNKHIIKGVK